MLATCNVKMNGGSMFFSRKKDPVSVYPAYLSRLQLGSYSCTHHSTAVYAIARGMRSGLLRLQAQAWPSAYIVHTYRFKYDVQVALLYVRCTRTLYIVRVALHSTRTQRTLCTMYEYDVYYLYVPVCTSLYRSYEYLLYCKRVD